jgi:raffinose/stachyose/melibiose transport system permease protein
MTVQTPLPIDAPRVARARPGRGHPAKEKYKVSWRITTIMVLASLAVLIPIYFAVTMALKTPDQTTGTGFSFPFPLHFENFKTAWQIVDTGRALVNSAFVSGNSVLGEIMLSSIAAWAIVRNFDKKFFRYSFFYILGAMFIPFPVVALPQIKLMALLHLDNPLGVAILHILFSLSFNILLYSAFIRSIPIELEESARMDGCTTLGTFRRVVLPLLAPMNATVGIFAFLQSWNDFMMPSLITSDPTADTARRQSALYQPTRDDQPQRARASTT